MFQSKLEYFFKMIQKLVFTKRSNINLIGLYYDINNIKIERI